MTMTENPETEVMKETAIEVRSPDELRELINEIPEGTVYSIDMGVIRVGRMKLKSLQWQSARS